MMNTTATTFRLSIAPTTLTTKRFSRWQNEETIDASWEFEDGTKVHVIEDPVFRTYRRYSANCRPTNEHTTPDKKARVFVSPGKFNLLEDLTNRTRRPYDAWRQPVLEALARIGIRPTKMRWSQRAGCTMCPCSPGFILEGVPEARRTSFHITLPDAPTVDETKPAREIVFN